MRESTRRLSVPVAEPAADSGQDVLDGALRVAQLNEDARWQFLLAEDTVNTARQTLRKLAAGEPLERVETLPPPAVTARSTSHHGPLRDLLHSPQGLQRSWL